MKLGIDCRSLGEGRRTGVGQYVLSMVRALSRIPLGAHTVRLWYSGSDTTRRRIREVLAAIPLDRDEFAVPNKVLNPLVVAGAAAPFSRFLARYDHVWMPNLNFYPYRVNPYSLTVHDVSFLHSREFYSWKRRLWHALVRSEQCIMHASRIIAVSEATRSALLERFPTCADKLDVLYPALPEYSAGTVSDSVASLPDEYLLYIGTIEPRKNIRAILQAFREISKSNKSIHLIIAGAKGWSNRNLFRLMKGQARVHWIDYVSEADKEWLYEHARMLVWPSFYEGFGFPPLESLRSGTPVLTSYRTSLPEVLQQHVYYVNPYNHGELIAVVNEALQDAPKFGAPLLQHWDDGAARLLTLLTTKS